MTTNYEKFQAPERYKLRVLDTLFPTLSSEAITVTYAPSIPRAAIELVNVILTIVKKICKQLSTMHTSPINIYIQVLYMNYSPLRYNIQYYISYK